MNRSFLLFIFILFIVISCSKDDENKAPTCTIGVIQNNMEILKGTPIYFPVYAGDEDGSISYVWISIDGEPQDTALAPPYEFNWQTQNVAPGQHKISAQARNAENEVAAAALDVKVIVSGDPVVPCPEAITISYEGQTYNTVKIGDQCWVKENMNVATENSKHYNDDPANGSFYGKLYNWDDAMTVCPPGWKLPSYEDWCTLVQHVDASAACQQNAEVGTDAGFKMKSSSGWLNGQSGSDQFGFRAVPAGFNGPDGSYISLGEETAFWSSTENADGSAGYWNINSNTTRITNNKLAKTAVLSVRCIKE